MVAVSAAVAVDGVVAADSGPLGAWVTLGPGRRVGGVTVREDSGGRTVSLRLVLSWGDGLGEVADTARRAALAALDERWPDDGPWMANAEITDVQPADAGTAGDTAAGSSAAGGAAAGSAAAGGAAAGGGPGVSASGAATAPLAAPPAVVAPVAGPDASPIPGGVGR